MENLKKAAAEASSFFVRAKQFTGEKLGASEKTIYDVDMEALIKKSDSTKNLTEKIIYSTEALLQPNPQERLEDFLLSKIDRRVTKPNNLELLGQCFEESGQEIGLNHQYGNLLVKIGDAEKNLGASEKEFVNQSSECFVQPLKTFLEGQMKTIQREKKVLESKRLELDACKAKLRKLSEYSNMKDELQIPQAEENLRRSQADFDRQCELTKLLMDELQVTYNYHLSCLADFVDAQMNYYNKCSKILQDLCKQIRNTTTATSKQPVLNLNDQSENFGVNAIGAGLSFNLNINNKKAKVLFDYEATDPSEISVSANQVINIQILPNDNDWVLGFNEKDGPAKNIGKVPKAYIQIIE